MLIQDRPYQQRIVTSVFSAYTAGCKNVLIESPAGSGKTIMAFLALDKIKSQARDILGKDDLSIGWVAMRRNLLAQAREANERTLRLPNVHFISMFDSAPPKVDVLVIDEAQHDAANSARHVYSVCDPKIALGLSATPYRADRMQLCFDKTIRDAGYHRLIQEGYLSSFDQYMLDEYNADKVTSAYIAQRERWGRSIIFLDRISECNKAAHQLKMAGVRCEVVTGQSDRESQLDRFEAGELDVLLNVYVLTEGFDCPQLKTVFVRDSSRGPTIQMAGRALRKHDDKPVANIVQSRNTKWPFVKTAKPLTQYTYVNGNWLSVGTNDRIEEMRKTMLIRIKSNPVSLPGYILKKASNGLNQSQTDFAQTIFNKED